MIKTFISILVFCLAFGCQCSSSIGNISIPREDKPDTMAPEPAGHNAPIDNNANNSIPETNGSPDEFDELLDEIHKIDANTIEMPKSPALPLRSFLNIPQPNPWSDTSPPISSSNKVDPSAGTGVFIPKKPKAYQQTTYHKNGNNRHLPANTGNTPIRPVYTGNFQPQPAYTGLNQPGPIFTGTYHPGQISSGNYQSPANSGKKLPPPSENQPHPTFKQHIQPSPTHQPNSHHQTPNEQKPPTQPEKQNKLRSPPPPQNGMLSPAQQNYLNEFPALGFGKPQKKSHSGHLRQMAQAAQTQTVTKLNGNGNQAVTV